MARPPQNSGRNHLNLSSITREIIEDYQSWLYNHTKDDGSPLSTCTQRTRLGTLQRFFVWLCENDHIRSNPATEIRLPRRPQRSLPKVLSRNELKRLMSQPHIHDVLGLRDRTILELFYATGIRRTELVNLDLQDVDPITLSVLIRNGKGGKDRLLPIGALTARWLQAYLQRSRPKLVTDPLEQAVFVSGYGTRFNPNYMGNWVSKTMRKAGVLKRGSCHLFRHSCATHMLENGADLRCIQQLLGHARLDTTQIYTDVCIRHLRAVYNATHPSARKKRN